MEHLTENDWWAPELWHILRLINDPTRIQVTVGGSGQADSTEDAVIVNQRELPWDTGVPKRHVARQDNSYSL